MRIQLAFEQPTLIPSITGGQVERFAPGDRFTLAVKTGQVVIGGRLVEITADLECQPAGAGSAKVAGVALHDADPTGEWKKVTVAAEGIWNLMAGGAIAAGDLVIAGAAGVVVTIGAGTFNQVVGIAVAAITNGTVGPVKLRL